MPAMSTSTKIKRAEERTPEGLPRVSYAPAVVVTLLAAVLLFILMLVLTFFGIANTATIIGRLNTTTSPTTGFDVAACGVPTLVALTGTVYFFTAIIKGIRDLGTPLYYTRGTVVVRREVQTRKGNNWLLLEPQYSGPDLTQASIISDEQRAFSVDRSQILQPRFAPGKVRRMTTADDESLKHDLAITEGQSGYLNPARISANQPLPNVEPGGLPSPRVVFRIDFASKAGFKAGEEGLVAHSRYLQHVYFVARLRNGEWEVYRNKSLI